jgi:hypothetical protein
MAMEQYAYAMVEGYVRISGIIHPVSSFQLTLTHNGIPSLRLTIDPVHIGVGNVVSSATGDALPALVSKFIMKFRSLNALTEQRTGREVEFVFKMVNNAGAVQALHLKKWLLVAVGYAGISASGSLQMNLDIQHPICKLAEGNIHMFANHADQKWDTNILSGASNVLSGIKTALAHYASFVPVSGSPAFFSELQDRTLELVDTLANHLVWEGNGWPNAPFSTLVTAIPHALQAYVMNIQGRDPWGWLIQDVISDWYLSTRITYWKDTLTLTPYTPWEEPQITITDADVSDFSMPAVDSHPIAGVVNLTDGTLLTGYTALAWQSGASNIMSDGQDWIEPTLPGMIDHLRLPEWVRGMFGINNSTKARYTAYSPTAANPQHNIDMPLTNDTAVGGLGPVDASLLVEVKTAMRELCKQTFCQTYRQMTQIALRCRLMLNASGGVEGHIAPGYVCAFASDPAAAEEAGLRDGGTGGTLLRFFVTQVTHTVDCANKTASTSISGRYLRREGGPNLRAIVAGVAPNYVYGTRVVAMPALPDAPRDGTRVPSVEPIEEFVSEPSTDAGILPPA